MQCMMSHTQTSRSPDWGGRGKEGGYRSRSLQRGPPKEKLFVSGPCLPLGQRKSQTMQIKDRCSLAGLKSQGSGQKHTHFWLSHWSPRMEEQQELLPFAETPVSLLPGTDQALTLWVPRKVFVLLSDSPILIPILFLLFLLLRCVSNLDGYSHLTFLGHTGSCIPLNSLGKSVCFCLAAPSSGHQEVEGRPPWEATCLPPKGVPDSSRWAPPGIGLSRAPAGFSGEEELSSTPRQAPQTLLFSVTHPKTLHQQQPLRWRECTPQIQPAP